MCIIRSFRVRLAREASCKEGHAGSAIEILGPDVAEADVLLVAREQHCLRPWMAFRPEAAVEPFAQMAHGEAIKSAAPFSFAGIFFTSGFFT